MAHEPTTAPPAPAGPRTDQVALECALLALVVLGIDLATPRGVAESVLYVGVVLVAVRAPGSRLVYATAAACSLLTLLGFLGSPPGQDPGISVVNRGLAVTAVWAVALLAGHHQSLILQRQRLLAEREELLTKALNHFIRVCAWCKKVHDDPDEWRPLEAYVRDRTAATFTHGICPDCLRRQLADQGPSATGSRDAARPA